MIIKKKVENKLKKILNVDGFPTLRYPSVTSALHRYAELDDAKYPKKEKTNYIGIEIECFADCDDREISNLILENDLEEYINVGEDGSIDTEDSDQTSFEIRVLATEKELPGVLTKLGAILDEVGADVNESCGLHVHLDMRNRNVERCYQKLVKFQDVLFSLVDEDRWSSHYCRYVQGTSDKQDRYTAINFTSYENLKTLEVRLHHGSVNMKEITNWVKLLTTVIRPGPVPTFKSKKQVLSWKKLGFKLKKYINETFDPTWLATKEVRLD